jgi:protein involved in polysaccharide export with SLBB domain
VGRLPLGGVLRVELEERVEHYVSRFVREPVVRARPLLQVSVQGEVIRAGYHGIPADAALVEVLTAAGGTTQEADLDDFRLERDGEKLLAGPDLQRALSERRTLNDVGIRDGDRFVVPRDGGSGVMDRLRFLWVVVSITGGVYGLSRAF